MSEWVVWFSGVGLGVAFIAGAVAGGWTNQRLGVHFNNAITTRFAKLMQTLEGGPESGPKERSSWNGREKEEPRGGDHPMGRVPPSPQQVRRDPMDWRKMANLADKMKSGRKS